MTHLNYRQAGVDITAGNEVVARIKDRVKTTFSPAVLTGLGNFASLYDLSVVMNDYRQPVLVQSIDGVGTKTLIARMMNKFDTLGIDLLSATCNDIIVLGAKPLTFLDYIANDKLDPDVIAQLVGGMVDACRQVGVSLVGGETAEMPNVYLAGEHDVVGVITGVVDKPNIIDGKTIAVGDYVYGFASNGLHTNGYSLARKIMFEVAKLTVNDYLDELGMTVGEALLQPHINYTAAVTELLAQSTAIKGMAHITGGGVVENIPRILPEGCAVQIDKFACPIPAIFKLMQGLVTIEQQELYRTFNMGIGFVLIGDAGLERPASLPLYKIGRVVAGHQQVILTEGERE